MITRRRVLVLGAGALTPHLSFAQQQTKLWRVGFLFLDTSRSVEGQSALEQFPAALSKLGNGEGKIASLNGGGQTGGQLTCASLPLD